MSSNYQNLARYLEQSNQDMIRMTFEEVENKMLGQLPPSAWKYRAWWSNSITNSQARHGWLIVGYETSNVDMDTRDLVFYRMTDQKANLRKTQLEPQSLRQSAPARVSTSDSKLQDIVNSAGGVENIAQVTKAIQQYIDGDLLETELGRILRKLWPRT